LDFVSQPFQGAAIFVLELSEVWESPVNVADDLAQFVAFAFNAVDVFAGSYANLSHKNFFRKLLSEFVPFPLKKSGEFGRDYLAA
jgi:hypothetical protein